MTEIAKPREGFRWDTDFAVMTWGGDQQLEEIVADVINQDKYRDAVEKVGQTEIVKPNGNGASYRMKDNYLVESVISQVGAGTSDPKEGPSMGSTPYKARIQVTFVKFQERKGIITNEVMSEIRDRIKDAGIPGIRVTVDKDAAGPPQGKPINIELAGDDYFQLLDQAEAMEKFINAKNIAGIEELKLDVEQGKPEMPITVDRAKARRLGISTGQIGSNLRTALFGKDISTYKEGGDDYDIVLRFNDEYRYNQQSLMNQLITFRSQSNIRTEARPIFARGADGTAAPLVPSDPAVVSAVRDAHEATLTHIRRGVGRTKAPLHSYFSLVADDRSLQLVSAAHRWHMEDVLKDSPEDGLPILIAATPFKAGGRGGPDYFTDVPAGDLAYKDVADLYFYPNTVCALKITGRQLAAWLDRSAALFRRIKPGLADQMLIDPACPSYNFDVIDGVTYRIDLSQEARFAADGTPVPNCASRIVDLRHAGRPVDPDEAFVIVTNNYRGGGGGGFPGARRENVIYESPDINRDIVLRYVRARGVIDRPVHPTWSFAPMPGTSVLFDTGPGALAYMDDLEGMRVERVGNAQGGFLRLRIHL